MFDYFRQTFLEPRGIRWFGLGLIIESSSVKTGNRIFAKLRSVLPYTNFDLLSKVERPGMGFLEMFRVKRPLGGLRLLLHTRKRYDLVVLFATGEGHLSLCRALALLVMRPKLFFVFNEFGEGFWLNRENWAAVRKHLEMRYRWRKRWDSFCAALRSALLWLARLPGRIVLMLYAALLFLAALLVLACLRIIYDRSRFRFRFFPGCTAAPRRKLDEEDLPAMLTSGTERAAHDSTFHPDSRIHEEQHRE